MLAGDCMGGTPVETETGAAMAALGGRRWDQKIHQIHQTHRSRGRRRSPSVFPPLPTQATVFLLQLSASLPRYCSSRTLGTAGAGAGSWGERQSTDNDEVVGEIDFH